MLDKPLFLPKGFTRGIPTEEGCYVMIARDGASYEMYVRDLVTIREKEAPAFDVRPGLCIANLEGYFEEPDLAGVVAYMKLECASAWDLYVYRGELLDRPDEEN